VVLSANPKIPHAYVPGSYINGDQVSFIKEVAGVDTLGVFKVNVANTSDEPGTSSDWVVQEFNASTEYKKGDQISMNSTIWESLINFTPGGAPYTFNTTSEWKPVVSLYNQGTSYTAGDLVVQRLNASGTPAIFKCLGATSSRFNPAMWLHDVEVVSDERYRFIETASWAAVEPEVIAAPSPGTLAAVQFPRVRYAFASIEWSPTLNQINILIEAYASPLISRLDINTPPSSIDDINPHTIFNQDPTSDAFIPVAGNIPSYNQVLTALRTWGILEGIAERVKERANENPDTSIGTAIETKMDAMMDGATVKTTESISGAPVQNKIIDKATWDLIKF
jgi:hypothetical protein